LFISHLLSTNSQIIYLLNAPIQYVSTQQGNAKGLNKTLSLTVNTSISIVTLT